MSSPELQSRILKEALASLPTLKEFLEASPAQSDSGVMHYVRKRAIPETQFSRIHVCNNLAQWLSLRASEAKAPLYPTVLATGVIDHFRPESIEAARRLISPEEAETSGLNAAFLILPCILQGGEISMCIARRADFLGFDLANKIVSQASWSRFIWLSTCVDGAGIPARGLDTCNADNEVFLTEGCFDGLFLPNAVSAVGILSIRKVLAQAPLNTVPPARCTIVLDADLTRPLFMRIARSFLNEGYRIAMLPPGYEHKDPQALAEAGYSQEEIVAALKRYTIPTHSSATRIHYYYCLAVLKRAFHTLRDLLTHYLRRLFFYLRAPQNLWGFAVRKWIRFWN